MEDGFFGRQWTDAEPVTPGPGVPWGYLVATGQGWSQKWQRGAWCVIPFLPFIYGTMMAVWSVQ